MRVAAQRAAMGWPRVLSTALLVSVASVLLVGIFDALPDELAWDFRAQYYQGAEAVVDGRPLYVSPDDRTLDVGDDVLPYVYPPQLAVALAPLTALSVDAATVVALLVCLAAILGTLAVLGIRDIRCYAAVLLWSAAWNALEVVNLTPLLVFGAALAWRLRTTRWLGVGLGLAISVKLLLWPLLVWTLATRRVIPTLQALVVGLSATAVAWAVIGFQGLTSYPALLRRLSDVHAESSYSLVGVAAALGLDRVGGLVLMLGVGGGLLWGCVRSGTQGDDRRAFIYAIGASLALTPIAWQHYLLFLVVPLALVRPRFSAVWLLPVVAWVSPRLGHGDGLEPLVPAAVAAVMLGILLLRPVQLGARAPA